MREHFPNSSREGGREKERERERERERKSRGRAEELREGICIASSRAASGGCFFSFLPPTCFCFFSTRSANKKTEEEKKKKKKNRAGEAQICFLFQTSRAESQKRRKEPEKRRGSEAGRNTRQQWIAEWLSLTLGWHGFTHSCWRPSSTHTEAAKHTPMRYCNGRQALTNARDTSFTLFYAPSWKLFLLLLSSFFFCIVKVEPCCILPESDGCARCYAARQMHGMK